MNLSELRWILRTNGAVVAHNQQTSLERGTPFVGLKLEATQLNSRSSTNYWQKKRATKSVLMSDASSKRNAANNGEVNQMLQYIRCEEASFLHSAVG